MKIDYNVFLMFQISTNSLWIALLAGVILTMHLIYLLAKEKAELSPFGKGRVACCGDVRENPIREMTIFGGASAFDWGILYWLIGAVSEGLIRDIALGYALMRSLASLTQSVNFAWQARQTEGRNNVELKAHLDGCGYTTAASPFWWLYWLSKLPLVKKTIIPIRDFITRVDYFFSMPGIGLLNLISWLMTRRKVLPRIGRTAVND
jgi:hypothetical protein